MENPDLGKFYEQQPKLDLNNLPPGWTLTDGVLSFGHESAAVGALDAWQYSLHLQARWLGRHGANDHPTITATRASIDWEKRWDPLAGDMASGAPALSVLMAQGSATLSETLDDLNFHQPNFPDERESLTAFWRNVYFHGTGVFHLNRFMESIDPTQLNEATELERQAATGNLLTQPVAFLNCLNAARLYAHPYPIEGVSLAGRPNNPFDEDVAAFQHDALQLLGSRQVQERPFATWYLLSVSAVKRLGTALTRPLLDASGENASAETVAALDRINVLVAKIVSNEWNGWDRRHMPLDLEDIDGRISGALEYGRTDLYPHRDRRPIEDEDAYEAHREQQELIANDLAEIRTLTNNLPRESGLSHLA